MKEHNNEESNFYVTAPNAEKSSLVRWAAYFSYRSVVKLLPGEILKKLWPTNELTKWHEIIRCLYRQWTEVKRIYLYIWKFQNMILLILHFNVK